MQRSSSKLNVLGVCISYDEMGEVNFCRCTDAWRSRALSFSGRAVVLNSLAISKISYVASVVAMPKSVLKELNTRILFIYLFIFFLWAAGKKDLVARIVLYHSKSQGGFSEVSVELQIHPLLGQWFRCFGVTPRAWVSLITSWCFDRFVVSPMSVLCQPSAYDIATPPTFFYH